MYKRILIASVLASVAMLSPAMVSSAVAEQQWGDLKVKFVFKGKIPERDKIQITTDQQFCGQHELKDESLLIDATDHGVANIIMVVYEQDRGGIKLPAIHPDLTSEARTVELANKDCRFEPHVVILKAGDTLKITNPDDVAHNCNLAFFKNDPINVSIPPKDIFMTKPLTQGELAPIPCVCNIHTWMNAQVMVAAHPYAAKSNEHGELTIEKLPAGEKLAFRLLHERVKFRNLKVGGDKVNRFSVIELKLKPGMNDLGTVELSEDFVK